MGTVEERLVGEAGSQGKIPPPPGADAGGSPPPPGYYPPYAGWYAQPQAWGPAPEPRRSGKPKIVGMLLMFSGTLSIIMAVFFGAMMVNIVPWMNEWSENSDGLGEIEGDVIYLNSTPAPGVNVTVVDLNLLASTNDTGHYRILNVPNGWHDLKIEMPGYKTYIMSVYVNIMDGKDTNQGASKADFSLQPGNEVERIGKQYTPGSKKSPMDPMAESILRSMGGVCLVVGIVLGSLAILGGYYAFRTEKLAIVALGALSGILSFGFAIGAGLAFIALILLLLSTDEFERAKREREKAA